MRRILKDNFYRMLPEYNLDKQTLEEFKPYCDMNGLALFYKDHELEFGFFDDASLEQKALFYQISSKYAAVIKTFLKEHEENYIIAALCEGCLTDGMWYHNRKNYDCCHNYEEYFGANRIYMLDVSTELDLIDYVLENVLRGFYDVQILLPNSKIILDINVHCSVGWFGEHVHDYYDKLLEIMKNFEMADFVLEKRHAK